MTELAAAVNRLASAAESVIAEHREAVREREGHRNAEARQMTAALFLNSTGLAEAFRAVPGQFIADGWINCLCGDRHAVPELGELVAVPCARHFIRTRNGVLAYREPAE